MKKVIKHDYLTVYGKKQRYSIAKHLKKIDNLSNQTSAFAFTKSSVFSSLIEGSGIDFDNYVFNKETGYKSKGMNQIEDLIKAYQYAKTHTITLKNVLQVHKILSNSFDIDEKYKGTVRDKEVRIGNFFTTVYTGAKVTDLKDELKVLFTEIDKLLKRKKYTYNEAFYFASFVHLSFVNIHPFADGNGRLCRLLEKWFLSKVIGNIAWNIPSEINYWIKREAYYDNLKIIGKSYETLNYDFSLPFLLMLPTSFGLSKKYYK